MPPDRLPARCMRRLFDLSLLPTCNPRFNWVKQLRSALGSYGMALPTDAVLMPDTSTLRSLLTALPFLSRNMDLELATASRACPDYGLAFHETSLQPQNYLMLDWPISVLRPLAQLRVLPKHAPRILVAGVRVEFSLSPCPICNWGVGDSALHLVLQCPMLSDSRRKFLHPVLTLPLTYKEQFRRLLTTCDRNTANRLFYFLREACEVRALILSI